MTLTDMGGHAQISLGDMGGPAQFVVSGSSVVRRLWQKEGHPPFALLPLG